MNITPLSVLEEFSNRIDAFDIKVVINVGYKKYRKWQFRHFVLKCSPYPKILFSNQEDLFQDSYMHVTFNKKSLEDEEAYEVELEVLFKGRDRDMYLDEIFRNDELFDHFFT